MRQNSSIRLTGRGAYVDEYQSLVNNRVRKNAHMIIRKRLTIRIIGATAPIACSGFPHSFATCPSGLSISIGLAAFSPTSGRLGFSPDWPGSPLLGSCGPGREKTPISHAWPTPSGTPAGRCLTINAVILDSQRQGRPWAKPGPSRRWQRLGHRGPAAPAGWQEITALSFRRDHPADHPDPPRALTGHQRRREPAPIGIVPTTEAYLPDS